MTVDLKGGPRATSRLERGGAQEIEANELFQEQIQYDDVSTPMNCTGQIRLDQFDSLEKSKSELAALEKDQQQINSTGEGQQNMAIFNTGSGKKQGVAVSQELHGNAANGLINIQTVIQSEIAEEHYQKDRTAAIMKNLDEELQYDPKIDQEQQQIDTQGTKQSAVLTPSVVSHQKKNSTTHHLQNQQQQDSKRQQPPASNKVNYASRRHNPYGGKTTTSRKSQMMNQQHQSGRPSQKNTAGAGVASGKPKISVEPLGTQDNSMHHTTEPDQDQPSNTSQLVDLRFEDNNKYNKNQKDKFKSKNILPKNHVYQSSQGSMTTTEFNELQNQNEAMILKAQQQQQQFEPLKRQQQQQQTRQNSSSGGKKKKNVAVISPQTQTNKYHTANNNVIASNVGGKVRTLSVHQLQQRPMFGNQVTGGLKTTLTTTQIGARQRRSVSNRAGSKTRGGGAGATGGGTGGGHGKDKMAEIYQRYGNGKVTQIDLSATANPRHNSAKRPSITIERAAGASMENKHVLSDAIKQLTKSIRSESKGSLTRQMERSTSRKSTVARDASLTKDLTLKFLKNSQLHQNLCQVQYQQQNNSSTQDQNQSLALPNQDATRKYEMNTINDTDIYSDTGTPSGAINQTAGPLSSNSLLNDKLSCRRKSRRRSSRVSKGKQMQELYDKFRHAQQDDPEAIKKKAIRQLKKSFASEKSSRSRQGKDNRSNRSQQSVRGKDLEDDESHHQIATNNAKNTTYNRTDTYDIYSNSAGAESNLNATNHNQKSSTGNGSSSIVGTRRIDMNYQSQKLTTKKFAAHQRQQQLNHVPTTQDRMARQKALKNAPSPRLPHLQSPTKTHLHANNANNNNNNNSETTSRQTAIFGNTKMGGGSKGTPKISSPLPKKYIQVQSLKSVNLKDRLTETAVVMTHQQAQSKKYQQIIQEKKRSTSRRESTSQVLSQRHRSVSTSQKMGLASTMNNQRSTYDLEKFKNYSNHVSVRGHVTMQRNRSMHQIAATNRASNHKLASSSIQQPTLEQSGQDSAVRRIQPRMSTKVTGFMRSKVTGFFAATQQTATQIVERRNSDAVQTPQNRERVSGAMFSRATSNGRRAENNRSLPPTHSITFGKLTNSQSNRRQGELSRRSMSVTHTRGKELEDASPSRLSKVMSSKDLLSGDKNHHQNSTTLHNAQVRQASVSSMKNNRLLDRKASMYSRISHRSLQASQRSRSQHRGVQNQPQYPQYQSNRTKLKPAIPPRQQQKQQRLSQLQQNTARLQLNQQKAALQRKSTKVGALQLDGIATYGIVKTTSQLVQKPAMESYNKTSQVIVTNNTSYNQKVTTTNKVIKSARYQPQVSGVSQRTIVTTTSSNVGFMKPGLLNKQQKVIGVNKMGQQQTTGRINNVADTGNSATIKRKNPVNITQQVQQQPPLLQPPYRTRAVQMSSKTRFQ